MMASVASTRVRSAPAAPVREERERHLRPVGVPDRRRRPRLAYAMVAVAGALAIAGAQMGLSVLTTQDSYRVAELSQRSSELHLDRQALADDIAGMSSPQYLAANASSLGMVIDSSPSYLRLSDAAVVGAGQPAGGTSTVDAGSQAAVGNALVSDIPLVTDPNATLEGEKNKPGDESNKTQGEQLPPPVTEGLPSPSTR